MGNKALIFDISTKLEGLDGAPNQAEIQKAYKEIKRELVQCGFVDHFQRSGFKTTDGEGIKALIRLLDRKHELPLFCKYKSKVHWLSCDEYSDITEAFN